MVLVWYGIVMVWYLYDMVWYDMVWYGVVWLCYGGFEYDSHHLFSLRSFHFNDMRIDEALRTFLETFRLPGEAPVIQHILEHFSEGYFVSDAWHVRLVSSSVLNKFEKVILV